MPESGTHGGRKSEICRGPPLRAPVTQQEELYRLEPPNGVRPKWNRPGRPLPVIEEPRGPGAEATGGMDGSETNGAG